MDGECACIEGVLYENQTLPKHRNCIDLFAVCCLLKTVVKKYYNLFSRNKLVDCTYLNRIGLGSVYYGFPLLQI